MKEKKIMAGKSEIGITSDKIYSVGELCQLSIKQEKAPYPDRRRYFREYYQEHRERIRHEKRYHQQHNLDYRLAALLRTVNHRCDSPKHISYRWYGAKGIKNFLTLDDLKYIWARDRAHSLKKPSLDRIDPNGHYYLTNVRFIELYDNQKRGWENKAARTKAIVEGTMKAKVFKRRVILAQKQKMRIADASL